MLFIVIIGVIIALMLLVFLHERHDRRYAEWVSDDLREYAGKLRLRLLDAADGLEAERGRGNRLAEASRENYYEKLRLGSLVEALTGELDDADELIEELEDIAAESLAGWTRAESIAERALTIAERVTKE